VVVFEDAAHCIAREAIPPRVDVNVPVLESNVSSPFWVPTHIVPERSKYTPS
jgi:hypothetical protein